MFACIFGGAIAGSVEDYLPYLLPGILVQTAITTSVVTGVQLREDMEPAARRRRHDPWAARFISCLWARTFARLSGETMSATLRYEPSSP